MITLLPRAAACIVLLLGWVGCGPTAPELDPGLLQVIDGLRVLPRGSTLFDEDEEVPEPRGALVRMGPRALPTILYVVEAEGDPWVCYQLMQIAARIGDPCARPALERLLQSPDSLLREGAIDGIGRLGLRESSPALRAAVAKLASEEKFVRLQFLEALYRVGDMQALGEVIEIGKSDRENRFFAAHVLLRHAPLRAALGFTAPYREGGFELFDEELFLPAAEEWYVENVLGEPSPWRQQVPEEFTPPCAAAKRDALALLVKAVADGNGDFSNLRVQAADPAIRDADGERSLVVLSGAGHGQWLAVGIWQPEADAVRCHYYSVTRHDGARSAFPNDCWDATYRTVNLPRSRYLELVAGLRAILEARLVPWWHGTDCGDMWSSYNFVTDIQGLGSPEPSRFCGYECSAERLQFEALRAAERWEWQFLDGLKAAAKAEPTPAARRLFSEFFRSELPHWKSWWWVRDRMLGMAAECGDDTLREPLATFLTPEFTQARKGDPQTASVAATALAKITGVDLRFGADGSARPIVEVAAAYRELLAR